MRRTCSALLALAGLALVVTTACSKADAASGSASPAASKTAAATATPLLTPAAAGRADSLSDSALIFRADRGRVMGRDAGDIWVVMISDFQCPYCKQWHDSSMARLTRDYITPGKVHFAYLNLPLSSIHKHARAEAEASMCASVQDKFWPYTEGLFKRQHEVESLLSVQPLLETVAREVGLDMPAFTACQKREAIRAIVASDVAQATKAGVRSTPSFLIGDFLVEGNVPYKDFRRAIDTAMVVARGRKTR
jgi:protein-disulfide isomerase